MWLDEVMEVAVTDEQVYERMSTEHDSIVIYGTGSCAKQVTALLESHGIKIAGYATSPAFYVKEYLGKPVWRLDEIMSMGGGLCLGVGAQYRDEDDFELFEIISGFKENPKVTVYSLKEIINNHDEISCDFLQKHFEAFNRTYGCLGDELSKECFVSYLKGIVSGNACHKMADKNAYFNDLTKCFLDKTVIDCGAFNGDTIDKFIKFTNGDYAKVYAIEADINTVKELKRFINNRKLKNIVVVPKGVSEFKGEVYFDSRCDLGSTISQNGNVVIEVDTIDHLVKEDEVSFIKMDIEGSELQALKGANKTIRDNMPAMAVCVYHRRDDLITIPDYIKSFDTDEKQYVLYLRKHHYASNNELVMYAVPN